MFSPGKGKDLQHNNDMLQMRDREKQAAKQEAVRIGKIVIQAMQNDEALRVRIHTLQAQCYQISETPHFIVCQQRYSQKVIMLHTFSQSKINADLICLIKDELSSFGLISSAREFGAVLFGVMASTFTSPRQQRLIWRMFCLNTLKKLREQLDAPLIPQPAVSYIAPFAVIYRRVFDLFAGQSLLDVGTSFGFLPILMAACFPGAYCTGCDSNPDAIAFAIDLAEATSTQHALFRLQDLCAADFPDFGTFDTVTAIHLLEHLSEDQLPQAFEHLLRVTRHRLLVAVPYEEQPTLAYGHEQVFNREKLELWGQWCVDHLEGASTFSCEDVQGGLLMIERC